MKICFITGTRAEYGLLHRLMLCVKKDKKFKLNIMATGMHLSKKFGLTYKEIVSDGFKIDEKIKGKINWEIRYKHMRMHTALHLLCSLIPYDVTGGQISYEKSRLDFNADDKIEKEEIENKINQLVKDDHEISYQWITLEELDNQPDLVRTMSVKPPRTNNKIRLVKIGSIDLQPCGGTHVKRTKEIGNIRIGKIENKGKMNRRVNLSISD